MPDSCKMPKLWTVSELTSVIKNRLERDFSQIDVEGEISGWRPSSSGHVYFTLKDSGAVIAAVMFANAYRLCPCASALKDGAKVKVRGEISVYPPKGGYQIVVRRARLLGDGELMQKYLELKAKLEAEGLFDSSRKRQLPKMPRRIGIVTSETGAVIHDMCTVLTRRFPNLCIRLFPCLVQGQEAADTIRAGVEYFNLHRGEWCPDLLIIARGGGSFEDLFCFNDEGLVRTVANSAVPTISAVGHETDFTLCDFAADVRAGTPSIAAEIAVPKLSEIVDALNLVNQRLQLSLRNRGEYFAQRIDQLFDAMTSSLKVAQSNAEHRLDRIHPRLVTAMKFYWQRMEAKFANLSDKLTAYSPYGVLDRGYSLTTTKDGSVIRDASMVKSGDVIVTRFANGTVESVLV